MANSLDDLKTAISQIQDLLRQLAAIDSEAARMEDSGEDVDPDDETGVSPAWEKLYNSARQLWRSIYQIADEYELNSDRYFDTDAFESYLVSQALLNA